MIFITKFGLILLSNWNFWSNLSALTGTILVFYFGLPQPINSDGSANYTTEPDESQRKIWKKYKILSYLGLSLIALSFLIQLINVVIISL